MLAKGPKRQKLNQAKSTSVDANGNWSIISMFSRQESRNQLQNAQPYTSEVTDRPRLNDSNRLSLSSRRKLLCTDTVNISGPSHTFYQLTDEVPDNTDFGVQTGSLSLALLPVPPAEKNFPDTVCLVSSDQEFGSTGLLILFSYYLFSDIVKSCSN